jgi:hypothetical protein
MKNREKDVTKKPIAKNEETADINQSTSTPILRKQCQSSKHAK